MNDLYPLKFNPIYKEKIWGGQKLATELQKDISQIERCGESWEISAVQGDISKVKNGFLKGNNLQELIEVYMGDLVGDKVYQKFGMEFPLLIKFIDANDDLSIQVHPDDDLAKKRHNAYGKTEMWYVIDAEKDAKLISGFNRDVTKKEYMKHIENNSLPKILNYEKVKTGDVFFIPAGRIHAIGKGILLTEIQQTSDVTYRIYDYNRKGKDGKPRELHNDLALSAIDFSHHKDYRTHYEKKKNDTANIVQCPYFTTNIIDFDKKITKDFSLLDTFVIYICLEGSLEVIDEKTGKESLNKGETVLLPATMKRFELKPIKQSTVLEVFIK